MQSLLGDLGSEVEQGGFVAPAMPVIVRSIGHKSSTDKASRPTAYLSWRAWRDQSRPLRFGNSPPPRRQWTQSEEAPIAF